MTLAGWAILGATAAAACPGPQAPCAVAGGAYHVALPEGPGPHPVVMHLHGWGGDAAAEMPPGGPAGAVLARGFALIAPQGVPRGEGGRADWAVRDGRPAPRDDVAFLRAVLDDAAARFPLDRARVLLSGFSRGGSFVWDVACTAPGLASAYAAVAGGFWAPLPAACAGPVRLHHTHGFADGTVPLEGRPLRSGAAQGDIFAGLAVWRAALGCGQRAGHHAEAGSVWLKRWTDCAAGTLDLVLHPGGHGVPGWWPGLVLDWFEGRPG